MKRKEWKKMEAVKQVGFFSSSLELTSGKILAPINLGTRRQRRRRIVFLLMLLAASRSQIGRV